MSTSGAIDMPGSALTKPLRLDLVDDPLESDPPRKAIGKNIENNNFKIPLPLNSA